MGFLEDLMKALDRVPGWKRITATPAELDALKVRVAALEARLAPASGDACPSCRAISFKLLRSVPEPGIAGAMGAMQDEYACSACGYTNVRKRDPG